MTASKTASRTSKSSTKAKPRRSRKSSKASQAEGAAKIADIRMIPLSQLVLSPKNVRKVAAGATDDAELLASIREEGVKQNLVVYAGDKDTFLVDAGGRRLKALQTLADEGAIPEDHPVACLVEDECDATMSSTIENTQRAAMHPADEYEAYASLIDEGRSEEDIARKFGVTVAKVQRRLKLARVAPEILEAFRTGDITLECVMAFTLTDHHDRQMTVWQSVKDSHYVHAQAIKNRLTETSYSAGSTLGKFVGVEAYEAAGGTVMSDLFSDRDTTYFENPELVERLALEKLQKASETYLGDWKWVDTHLELDHGALRSFGRVQPQELPDDHELLQELKTLTAREEELARIGDERDATDEEIAEYEAIEARLTEIDDEIEAARPFAEENRAIAGVVLTIGWHGELQVTRGLVRPEDIPAQETQADDDGGADTRVSSPTSSTPVPVADPAAAMRKAEGMPNSLADDLRTARHHILRAHLSGDYDVAFDALLYTMCKRAFSPGYVSGLPMDVSLTRYHAPNGGKLVSGSVADRMIEGIRKGLNLDWMELEQPEDFKALCALSIDDKQALFAFAVATALKAQLATDNGPSPVIEELGARLDVDVAACWRPTAANYWSSVTKAHIASVAQEVIDGEFAEERTSEKKGEAAAAMEQAFAETAMEAAGFDKETAARTTRWLPKGMAFAGADFADEPLDAVDVGSSEEGELPAFMTDGEAA
ncbi:MAG: ParB/RepB/Spo0J family partition protein [Ahrensia sp.]|nr:ParB/RepB/Spo0J family partition protein [Ahrensia sp.]